MTRTAPGVVEWIKEQVREAGPELRAYPPEGVDWVARADAAVDALVPWLVSTAPSLKAHVEQVMNAPHRLRTLWDDIRQHADLPAAKVGAFDRQLAHAKIVFDFISGELVSKVVSLHLQAEFPESALTSNKGDYPDLFVRTFDYSALPRHTRMSKRGAGTKTKEYGASLKGAPPRPVRVPDGLEIKTCREGSGGVDCHYPHAGLHLVLWYDDRGGEFTVDDVTVAFLRRDDYLIRGRNTEATTVKASFSPAGDNFVSVLHPKAAPSASEIHMRWREGATRPGE